MNDEINATDVGRQLGQEGVDRLVNQVERYCAFEEQRIALVNEAGLVARKAELSLLLEREQELKARVRLAPPPGDQRNRKRKALYSWGVTLVLTVAGFFFSLLAFDPYRLGPKSYLYCLGVAIITPYAVGKSLEEWENKKLIRMLATVTCVSALAALVLLAVIRGDLLAQQVKEVSSVVLDEEPPAPSPAQDNFYEETLILLRIVMGCLAVAMELGAGLALDDGWKLGSASSENWHDLQRELGEVRARMVGCVCEITALQNESKIFAAGFWRNFYYAMLTHTLRSALTKRFVLMLGMLFLIHGRMLAQGHLNLVVAIDLTQSVAVEGPDHKTEFKKNIETVTRMLAQVPAVARVTVLGITEASFSSPYVLLSAEVPADEGYFKEKVAAVRRELVRAWQTRSAHLEPRSRRTDVLGALLVASELFLESPDNSRNVLVILSDMRHSAEGTNLESPASIPDFSRARLASKGMIANLRGVEIYALGVNGTDRSVAYYYRLTEWWKQYFRAAGATLQRYSGMRDLPLLAGK